MAFQDNILGKGYSYTKLKYSFGEKEEGLIKKMEEAIEMIEYPVIVSLCNDFLAIS